MRNISVWENLLSPFFVLAPMENVTDTVFRQIVLSCGKPDIFFTEFTNTDGMTSVGRKFVEKRLLFTPNEQPLVAQIWGTNPKHFYETAKICVEMGFSGIDINMGCPVKDVMMHGSCAALIDNPVLARQIIQETKKGAGDLPVSVKTRIGTKTIQTDAWTTFLLEQDLAALTIHGRTAKEQSLVPAHWEEIAKVVKIRNQMKRTTKIIGNGDVMSREEGLEKVRVSGVDGVMIGRGIFRNPWIFNPHVQEDAITQHMRFEKLLEHINLYESTWSGSKPFPILKKFVKAYVQNFDGAAEMRAKLMETKTLSEMKENVELLLHNL
jgi:tRNA-dihydrouridine synthase